MGLAHSLKSKNILVKNRQNKINTLYLLLWSIKLEL